MGGGGAVDGGTLSSMCKCVGHLIKSLLMRSRANANLRNVTVRWGFETRSCSPLVSVCEMRELTAATKLKQELISSRPFVE